MDIKPSLTPDDIPRWFIGFARHVLSVCNAPGVYHITLEIPSAEDQAREVQIARHLTLRLALCDNAERPRIQHPEPKTHRIMPQRRR